MHIEVQVEEPSAEEALRHLLPKVVGGRATFKVVNYGSKRSLLNKLPSRLQAYAARIRDGERLKIVILVDRDSDDCRQLKARLERMVSQAGLASKAAPDGDADFVVATRLAIEELEAWFLGDERAVRSAFPRVPPFARKARFRDPDAITGGTWEALHRLLKRHGSYPEVFPKIEVARRIAPHLDVNTNRSASFRTFCGGVEALLASAITASGRQTDQPTL
ncbi:MAG: DUF4276 family protein [Rhodospirillales bacterium]|nr:MAG: DUF4276 family protein [Rhodospirillales bacterium]